MYVTEPCRLVRGNRVDDGGAEVTAGIASRIDEELAVGHTATSPHERAQPRFDEIVLRVVQANSSVLLDVRADDGELLRGHARRRHDGDPMRASATSRFATTRSSVIP